MVMSLMISLYRSLKIICIGKLLEIRNSGISNVYILFIPPVATFSFYKLEGKERVN